MSSLIPPLFRASHDPEPLLQAEGARPLRPRSEPRHTPSLSSVRVEFEDGDGLTHSGQLWNISPSGAALCFSRCTLAASMGLLTTLRLCSRTRADVLALPVEVRWIDHDHGACFVGVRFEESPGQIPFVQDLLAA